MEALNPNIYKLYYSLSWTFLHSLWQASLIALATTILIIILNQLNPALKYKIWISANILFVVINYSTFFKIYSNCESRLHSASISLVPTSYPQNYNPISEDTILQANPTDSKLQETSYFLNYFESFAQYINNKIHFIMLLWLIGMLLFLMRFLGGLSYVYYIKSHFQIPVDCYWETMKINLQMRMKLNKQIQLAESALVQSVIVIGHLKPIILFPAGWINKLDPKDVEAILLHELAHVCRNDYLTNLMQSVMELIYYFNPMVWYLSSKLREEREHCCDDIAIACGSDPIQFAKSLLLLQQMHYRDRNVAIDFSGGKKYHLLERVKRILQPREEFYTPGIRWASLLAVTSIIFGIAYTNLKASSYSEHALLTQISVSNTKSLSRIDSFLLRKQIPDGTYTFTNNQLTSKIVVQENKVYQLNFNGVEVSPENFSKFEDYFYTILDNQFKNKANQPASYESSDKNSSFIMSNSFSESNNTNTVKIGQNPEEKANGINKTITQTGEYTIIAENDSKKGIRTIKTYKNGVLIQEMINDDRGFNSINQFDKKGKNRISKTAWQNSFSYQINDPQAIDHESGSTDRKEIQEMIDQLHVEVEDLDFEQTESIEDFRSNLQWCTDQLSNQIESLEQDGKQNKETKKIISELSKMNEEISNIEDSYNKQEQAADRKDNLNFWQISLYSELIRQGNLNEDDRLIFQWNDDQMVANGKTLDRNEFNKIQSLYKQITGTKSCDHIQISIQMN
ncbi:MAG TPA: M56 family metallopeptidase [Saprospiraceae bacterium]|nr:M56 family metallopeptidase [Saprospiraceae bacterium]